MPIVRCTVSNCEYWAQHNFCAADQILITAGTRRGKDHQGDGAEHIERSPVEIAQDSYCLTFHPRQETEMDRMEQEAEVEADLIPPTFM